MYIYYVNNNQHQPKRNKTMTITTLIINIAFILGISLAFILGRKSVIKKAKKIKKKIKKAKAKKTNKVKKERKPRIKKIVEVVTQDNTQVQTTETVNA